MNILDQTKTTSNGRTVVTFVMLVHFVVLEIKFIQRLYFRAIFIILL